MKLNNKKVLILILGGGQGSRLYPLTKDRAKPAVPIASKYRIVDIPISLSINSGFNNIYILTQFNSASLNGHLSSTYVFDNFSNGFAEILAAEQTFNTKTWYEGTADAVRKNIHHFKTQKPDYIIILSGDQLYRMDLYEFLQYHIEKGSDITISATPVNRQDAAGFGIINSDNNGKIKSFIEKPKMDLNIDDIKIPQNIHPSKEMQDQGKYWMGSMGMYCFKADVLYDSLDNDYEDFGKTVIPKMLEKYSLYTYIFTGFWEDIGTIKSYFETSLSLCKKDSPFSFYDEKLIIYSSKKQTIPPAKIIDCVLKDAIIAEGVFVEDSNIKNSVIGQRVNISSKNTIENAIIMGSDFFESKEEIKNNKLENRPTIGIGKNCKIKNTIMDKNVRVGDNVSLGQKDSYEDGEYNGIFIKDGIIVIPKNFTIPNNFTL